MMQETMAAMARSQGGAHVNVSKLNNVLMQMRKNCNHPDLIKGAFDGSITYPTSEEIRAQCGKMQLLERMLRSLHKGGHKVLIFSQVQALQHCMTLNSLSGQSVQMSYTGAHERGTYR